MREQLIQLIKQAHTDYLLNDDYAVSIYEFIADRLIEAGAILPTVKVGQTVYRVGDPEYVDDSDNRFTADDIGKTVFLTREAAEAALEAREKQ